MCKSDLIRHPQGYRNLRVEVDKVNDLAFFVDGVVSTARLLTRAEELLIGIRRERELRLK